MRWRLSPVVMLFAVLPLTLTCAHDPRPPVDLEAGSTTLARPQAWDEARRRMVANHIAARGVHDSKVLQAMRKVPRHLFVPAAMQTKAYQDTALPIGHGQTISQPYIVAYMTQAARILPTDRVLEIGTGSGYQAAVLACLSLEVYTIEIVEPLGRKAKSLLESLGYENIRFRIGDGYDGWPERAPFDAIVVTAAPPAGSPASPRSASGGRKADPATGWKGAKAGPDDQDCQGLEAGNSPAGKIRSHGGKSAGKNQRPEAMNFFRGGLKTGGRQGLSRLMLTEKPPGP